MKSWKLYIYGLLAPLMPETRCFGTKSALLRWCGARIGKDVRISSSARFLEIGNLEIGDDVWIGSGCRFMAGGGSTVRIGSHVDIAPEVLIATGTHEIDPSGEHSAGNGLNMNITIEDGTWLCERSVLLPGVVVGEKAVVGAGALVNKDVPPRSVVVGVPAKVVKTL